MYPEGGGVIGKGGGRQRDVVDQLNVVAELSAEVVDDFWKIARVVDGETTSGESDVLREIGPLGLVGCRIECRDRLPDVVAELVVGAVPPPVADQRPRVGEQPLAGQLVEGRQHHAFGEIACGTE